MKNGSGGTWLMIIIVVVAIILGVATFSDSGSSSSTPWGKLGVSKSEYQKVYNYYKYN